MGIYLPTDTLPKICRSRLVFLREIPLFPHLLFTTPILFTYVISLLLSSSWLIIGFLLFSFYWEIL